MCLQENSLYENDSLRHFLVEQFPSQSGKIDTLLSQIDQRGNLSVEFTKALARVASGDLDLFEYILHDHQVTSLQHVAERVCPLGLTSLAPSPQSTFPNDQLVAFRGRLLLEKPTALLYGLLASEAFPGNAELRTNCQAVLKKMQTANLDISKDSVRTVLGSTEYMTGIPTEQQQQVANMLALLQRLQAVVYDPDDILRLARASFLSAASIARTSQEWFTSAVGPQGIGPATATRIYQQAALVNRRNEQIWIKALAARNEIPLKSAAADPNDEPVNLSTLFKDLIQNTECADCSSITSPAAYFVDFLQCLTKWPKDKGPNDKSLRDLLFERRPDLGDLHLSCANTFVILPYIDLVNEALESVIAHSKAVVADVYDMDDSYDTDEITEPQNIAYEVYRTIIQPQLFPLGTFPYNFAVDSIRTYFQAFRSSRYELMQKLRTPYRLAPQWSEARDLKLASEVLERYMTAEYLGLQEEDYIAVTGEAVQTADFLGITIVDDYRKAIGLLPVSAYWGYDNKDDMVSLDEVSKIGLVFIKEQFLPRSELSFKQLLELLRSSLLQGRVVIEMYDGSAKFSGNVEDMRLRLTLDDGTVGPLDDALCGQLQAFVRLRMKLGWTVHDTAVVLTSLASTNEGAITPGTLNDLAAVKRLADETNTTVTRLLPLWGAIDVYEPGSLYASLFLSSQLSPANAIFQADEHGIYLPAPAAKLSSNIGVVLAAFQLSAAACDAIRTATNMSDELTIDNLSSIYRVSMFCKLIGIPPDKYPLFLSLGYTDHLASPKQTLQTIERYELLVDAGWTLEKVLFVTGTDASVIAQQSGFKIDDAVSATVKIINWNTTNQSGSDGSVLRESASEISPPTIAQILRSFFPRVADETIQYMISSLLTVGDGKSVISALSELKKPDLKGESFQGYFTPPVTGTYSFSAVLQPSMPELAISGVPVEFDEADESGTYRSQRPRRLLSGQAYEILWKGTPITCLQWEIGNAEATPFDDTILVADASTKVTIDVLVKLSQVAQLVETCALSVDEVHYYQQCVNGFDFNRITRQNIEDLLIYTNLRPASAADETVSPLLTFRKWLDSQSDGSSLTSRLAELGGWSEPHVRQVLDAHYPTMTDIDIISTLQDIRSFAHLHGAIVCTANLSILNLAPKLLYALVEPAPSPEDDVDRLFANAKDLRAAAQSNRSTGVQAANNLLRENRRGALVAYLLQQEYIQEQHLTDANALFEHFLIDVQMGSGFKTSRLKQAISVLQLYVQRCMLGLEEPYGVPRTVVKSEEWELTMRYRLWEANRKAFLYTENWIDPTLRDDKTEQFMAMETSIERKKLTNDSIEEAMTSYVSSMDDVAHLEMQAYLWERRDLGTGMDRDQGCIHFFACTATAPYTYYYRRVDIRGPKAEAVVFWKSWIKMDIGITAQETDSENSKLPKSSVYLVPAVFRGRLYLFIPKFTLKTMPKDTKDQPSSYQALGDEPPNTSSSPQERIWELTMGWSEFRNNKWSAQRIAPKALHIAAGSSADPAYESLSPEDKKVAERFPPIKSFQFSTRVRSVHPIFGTENVDILTIDVDRWLGDEAISTSDLTGYKAYPLGRFELRGQQLVLDEPDVSFTGMTTIPTDFMRLSWKAAQSGVSPKTTFQRYGNGKRPLLAVADSSAPNVMYTWILSLDSINYTRPTGFIANMAIQDDTYSFLGYPPVIPSDPNIDPVYDAFETVNLHNEVSPVLMEVSSLGGGLKSLYDSLSSLPQSLYSPAFGDQHGKVFHEQANPYAIYSWETGVHTISLFMERLKCSGQQELALSVGRLAFDPSWEDPTLGRVWRFPPFRDPDTVDSTPLDPSPTWENKWAIMEWNMNPAIIHAAGRGHPVAYMKRLAIKYMEILLDAGDNLFRQNTMESLPLALQRYVQAAHIFGPVPIQMPELQKRRSFTYNQLAEKLDSFSNATVDLEIDFPFQSDPQNRGTVTTSDPTTMAYIETGYFCIPSNPQIMALKNTIDDRMYKVRNNMDIDGHIQDRPLFEPPIDPGQLVRARAAGVSPSAFTSDIKGPMPKQRFGHLLQRAYQLTDELKGLESLVLTIKEKRDSEALLTLTASHRQAVQQLVFESKKVEKQGALKALDVLQETRQMHEQRLAFFLALTGDQSQGIPGPETAWTDIPQLIDTPTSDDLRMASSEKLEMDCTESAITALPTALALENVASNLLIFPQATVNVQPLGVGVSTEIGTGLAARALQAAASVVRQGVQHLQDQGTLAGKKSYLIRQLQERRQQVNQAGRDIKLVDQQILVQKLQVERIDVELQAQVQENENTAQELEWYQSKYTNEQLYTWLENQYSAVYYDTYTLASQLAQKVQKAYQFENPQDGTAYLNPLAGGYWDSSRDGLLSGARLSLDLKRIEMAYLNSQPYDFEIERNISLRQLHPLGLLSMRETGVAEFSLPETLFDMDFPGHYCRRIVSVSLRIPCITGAYVSLNCTLTLKSHTYRIRKDATGGDDYLDTDKEGVFRTDVIPITSIAVTSSHHDGGKFDFASYSEKYLPFEGAGAISLWRVELPEKLRQFDYQTISDVVMQLRFTAADGGQTLKQAASDATLTRLTEAAGDPYSGIPSALVDVACDYASQWYPFVGKLKGGDVAEATLQLSGIDGYLPFWARGFLTAKVYRVTLIVMPAISSAEFNLEQALVVTGPSSGINWTSSKQVGDSIVLQADDANQDLKAPGDWCIKFATAPPSTYVVKNMVLVLEYTLA
ncbi:hypothetical protein F4779DRAFT_616205 [Xylariaceae sp. FL0662B]|nr:hypothetical protein F4779DRAFT_616205 [Xylariaceae sp. FL0662B]